MCELPFKRELGKEDSTAALLYCIVHVPAWKYLEFISLHLLANRCTLVFSYQLLCLFLPALVESWVGPNLHIPALRGSGVSGAKCTTYSLRVSGVSGAKCTTYSLNLWLAWCLVKGTVLLYFLLQPCLCGASLSRPFQLPCNASSGLHCSGGRRWAIEYCTMKLSGSGTTVFR